MECSEDAEEASSYYVRLGTLSVKLRQRAYQRAVAKVHEARQQSQESITHLNRTMDVVGVSTIILFLCLFYVILCSSSPVNPFFLSFILLSLY